MDNYHNNHGDDNFSKTANNTITSIANREEFCLREPHINKAH